MNLETETTAIFSTAHIPLHENNEITRVTQLTTVTCGDKDLYECLDYFYSDTRSDEHQHVFRRVFTTLEKDFAALKALSRRLPHLYTLLCVGFSSGADCVSLDGDGTVYPWLKTYDW